MKSRSDLVPDLAAIRVRDGADMLVMPNMELFAQQYPDDEELRGAINMVRDRRILLAYVDALVAAARKVTCVWCNGTGRSINQRTHLHEPCPHCGDLRALLPKEGT